MGATLENLGLALIQAESAHVAHNYHPLPVLAHSAEGVWVTDIEGKRYLDLLSAYSALNFGHGWAEHARRGRSFLIGFAIR